MEYGYPWNHDMHDEGEIILSDESKFYEVGWLGHNFQLYMQTDREKVEQKLLVGLTWQDWLGKMIFKA